MNASFEIDCCERFRFEPLPISLTDAARAGLPAKLAEAFGA